MYEKYLNKIDEMTEKICFISDEIWNHPELAFSEHCSADYIISALEQEGFVIKRKLAGIDTAFMGSFGTGKPVIGILGEFDALANLSQEADLAEKRPIKENAPGHGCGHNLLGCGSLAAVIAIKQYLMESNRSGTVIYFGCPGEEGGSGKAFMAREGVFCDVDCAITWHPAEYTQVFKDSTLANVEVLYRFSGIAAHAAACPELGRSALDAVELMNVGTNFLREHMIQEARIHYAVTNAGGVSPNVVQSNAEVLYLIRAPKSVQVEELFNRVNYIAKGMAMATQTCMSYEIIKRCSNFIPNTIIEHALYNGLKNVPLPEYTKQEKEYARKFTSTANGAQRIALDKICKNVISDSNKEFIYKHSKDDVYSFIVPYEKEHIVSVSMGSSDVGDVSFMCPTSQLYACTWAPESGGHSWQIVAQGKSSIAHKGLLYAGKVMAYAAISLMENPTQIQLAKEEFEKKRKCETYIPIPKDIKPRSICSL